MRRILSRSLPFCLAVALSACATQAATSVAPSATPAASAPAAASPSGSASLPAVQIPYTRFRLANGLTVVVHEDHKAPVVAINVWYHVGSKDEPAGRHGFAHLFEHLMFNGSQHYDDEYFRALEPSGATDMNGTTNTDRTNYFETVPVAALDRTLWLESDRMGYLTGAINQAKLDEQRGVVLNEKRQGENQPYGRVDEVISRETYPQGHPYSWTTIGSEADLNAATVDDVKQWFKTYYGPNNATLVIAGDVDTADVKARVERYFGALPPGPPVNHLRDWPAPMTGDKHLVLEERVPLPRVHLVWNVPGDGRRDNALLSLVSDLLGSGRNSRLYRRLVYTDQLATDVSAGLDTNEIGAQFHISATAKPGGDLAPIVKAIEEELAAFLKDGPGTDELDAARISNYAGFVHGVDKVGGFMGKAGLLAANQVYHDDPGEYQREVQWQAEARPADLQAVARQWLTQGHLQLDVLPQPELKASGKDVERKALPALAEVSALKLPALQRDTLSNGLKLVLAERHSAPVVEFRMLLDIGRAADGGGKSGLSAAALGMMDEGAGALDALAIARRQDELGAGIGISTQRDVSAISLSAIKPKLAESLDLYASIIREPTFPEKDLARVKRQLLAAIIKEKAQPFGLARRALSRLLYGPEHAYAYQGVGNETTINSLTPEELRAFYTRWVRPDNATLLVVGDTTLAEIKPLLEARFGNWKAPAEALPVKRIDTVSLPAKPRVYLIDKPEAEQSLVLYANLAPSASDPDVEAMQLVDAAIGGSFISRLNLNLRENKHWSYGASSSLAEARGQQPFTAYAEVERAHTADSMREMERELREVRQAKPLTATEIDAARQSQTLSLPGEFESTPEVAAAIAHQIEFALPDDYWTALVPQLQALTPAQIQTAAQRMIHPEGAVWLIVGDVSRIEASVRKLGIGEVQVLDADGKPQR